MPKPWSERDPKINTRLKREVELFDAIAREALEGFGVRLGLIEMDVEGGVSYAWISGPPESPWEEGHYVVSVSYTCDYPFKAPVRRRPRLRTAPTCTPPPRSNSGPPRPPPLISLRLQSQKVRMLTPCVWQPNIKFTPSLGWGSFDNVALKAQ